MSIGMILDYIYEYMNLINPEENKEHEDGTKEDFEKYFEF